MKVLLYSHFFPPSVGGVESIVLSLARGLAEACEMNGASQFEIALVTQTEAGNYDDHALPFRTIRRPKVIQLWRLIQESSLVHVAGPALMPILMARLAGKPIVVEHHGFQTICPNGQLIIESSGTPCPGHFMAGEHAECIRCNASLGWVASSRLWLFTFVRRFLCKSVGANVVPTVWLGDLLRLPRVVHVPHGLRPIEGAPREATNSKAPLIAFQGRLVTAKGVRVLLEAARRLRDQGRKFEVLIIGEGPERDSLEELVRETGLSSHVCFAGGLSADELELALSRASMVVAPSLGGEVFGLVIAENMLRGLPIVASDLGAFNEVLAGAGLSFRTGDAAELVSRLAKMMDEPGLAAGLGQRAREIALHSYSLKSMLDSHAALYRRMTAQS